MPYDIDAELDLSPRIEEVYFISSAHRRRQANKSFWTVSADQEVDCFITSQTNSWVEISKAWGLLQNGNSLLILGQNYHNEPLKIAKFVVKNEQRVWHGYPADFCRNNQDRPGTGILKDWRTRGYIEKHHIVKIRQGKECNL
ncbi:MAG: hypothetical protein JNM41_03320 [Flavipsychrobacter sp.]|nr:hypothetical protein [Flavipsychrobacter sp.]